MSRIIELRPVHTGWKVFEGTGVEPVFPGAGGKESALSYASYLDLEKLITLPEPALDRKPTLRLNVEG
jgi:hypothetical protein